MHKIHNKICRWGISILFTWFLHSTTIKVKMCKLHPERYSKPPIWPDEGSDGTPRELRCSNQIKKATDTPLTCNGSLVVITCLPTCAYFSVSIESTMSFIRTVPHT